MTLIDQIRDLIAEGETQRSLDELYKYVKESNADVIDNLVMLRSRMQNLQRAVHNGTMDDQAATLERAKINEAILKLLPQLTPEYLAEASKRREPIRQAVATPSYEAAPAAPAKDMKKMYLIGGGALLVVILLIVMFSGGGDSEEGQQQIAADSTATTLPSAPSGNVAQQTTGSKSQPQTGGQTAPSQQNFQQQQPQTQQDVQQPQTQPQQPQPQASQAEDDLSAEWQSSNGSASFGTQDGTNWDEMENGVVKFKFKMKKETADYVEIYDASRGIILRLYDDQIQFQYKGESEWNVLAYGGWK